jgi:hypothetical protein
MTATLQVVSCATQNTLKAVLGRFALAALELCDFVISPPKPPQIAHVHVVLG